MAVVIRKRANSWRAEVRFRHHYRGKTFATKREAKTWSEQTQQEFYAIEGKEGALKDLKKTLKEAFIRYTDEISVHKKGARWEKIRLEKLAKEPFSNFLLSAITKHHIQDFIDLSLEKVQSSTVNRELNLLSAVFSQAIEWGWCEHNPIREAKRPKNPEPRNRRISEHESRKILSALDFDEKNLQYPLSGKQELAIAFLIAIETAMRQGEIWKLTWNDVFLEQRFVRLLETKNGFQRDVPLTTRAVELFKLLQKNSSNQSRVFFVRQSSAGQFFRRAAKTSDIDNLTFHDTRHEALTQLARKLDVLDLARMVGHRKTESLMIYYNPTPTEIAHRLG